ncbi:MAG: hypothetical protein AAF483_25565, partial [Planctomycetota bacterium]
AKDLPSPEGLKKEIAVIEGQMDRRPLEKQEHLRKRLEALRHRVASWGEVSQQRAENLSQKLHHRALEELEVQVMNRCQKNIKAFLNSGGRCVPDRLFKAPYDLLLPAIAELAGDSRELGIELLRRSATESKNNHPLEPENKRFLERLEQSGIRTHAWLEATEPQKVEIKGAEYSLSFATDALELLLMGYHFDTCLSPNSFNFFSAISNSIDVNKQVLYCKNQEGAVIGRCLFALNNAGQILTFNRYCHNSDLQFDAVVDNFAIRLAGSMKTCLSSKGPISPLVARKWYNDGAICGGLQLISSTRRRDSVLNRKLFAIPKNQIVAELIETLGSRSTVVTNLAMILEQPVFAKRLELAEIMADEFGFSEDVETNARFRIAMFCFRAHKTDAALAILQSIPEQRLIKRMRTSGASWDEKEVLDLLLEFDFRIARKYLRNTRAASVRSERHETCPLRINAIAQIYRKLGKLPA